MRRNTLREGIIVQRDTNKEVSYKMTMLFPEDIDLMINLQYRVINSSDFNPLWFYPFCEDELKDIMKVEGNIVLGIFAGEKLIAFRVSCIEGKEFREISKALDDKYEEGHAMLLNGVFVNKSFRGNHLQQKMSQYIIDECRKRGIETLMTAIHPDNIASIKSLVNIGFERKKTAKLYGGKYDRIIMVKENH